VSRRWFPAAYRRPRGRAFAVLLYLGLLAGILIARRAAASSGLDATDVTVAAVLLVAPALLGSRLLFAVLHLDVVRREPSRILQPAGTGAALYGALLAALATSVPLLHVLHVPIGAFWDAAAVAMLVALIPGRIGCLLNGCCSGRASDSILAIELADHAGVRRRRLPVQLFEAAWAAVLLVWTGLVWDDRPFDGSVFLLVLAAYAAARLVFEPMRESSDRIGEINVQQAISAVLVLLSIAGLLAG